MEPIQRENRKYNLCNLGETGDEFHYILNSKYFKEIRNLYINRNFTRQPNIINFRDIMASKNKSNLIRLYEFIRMINERVCPTN